MRITGWHIENYGVFSDVGVDTLAPRLNVIYGPNESGKSTILEFIRTILFGFPGRGDKNPFYPGSDTGFGGRLFITTDGSDRYVVERFEGAKGGKLALTLPDGSAGGQEDLRRLLGHASKDLFKNIFAFGMKEMRDLEVLGSDEVKNKIYSAGAGLGALPLADIVKAIEKEQEEIYKKSGSKNTIAQTLKNLETIGGELAELDKNRDRYEQLKKDERRLLSEITQKKTLSREAGKQVERYSSLSRALVPWAELQQAKSRLDELEVIDEFPHDGIGRLKSLVDKIESVDERLEKEKRDIKTLREKIKALDVDDRIIAIEARIKNFSKGIGSYTDSARDLPKREQELKDRERELKKALAQLGPEWTVEKVDGFDISTTAKETIRHYKAKLEKNAAQVNAALQRREDARIPVSDARKLLDEADKAMANMPKPEETRDELHKRKNAVKELRGLFPQYRITELKRKITGALSWFIVFGIILMIIGIVLGLVIENRTPSVIIASIGFAFSLLALVARLLLPKLAGKDGTSQNVEETILKNSNTLGSEKHLDERKLEEIDSHLVDASEKLDRWEKARKNSQEKLRDIDRAEQQLKERAESLEKVRQSESEVESEWNGWLKEMGLRPELSPDGAIDLINHVETTSGRIEAVNELRRRCISIRENVEVFEKDAIELLSICGRSLEDMDKLTGAVEELAGDLDRNIRNRDRLKSESENLAEKETEQRALEDRRNNHEEELKALLKSGGAPEPEEFRKRAGIFEERNDLDEKINRLNIDLAREGGTGDKLKDFVKELAQIGPVEIRAKISESEESQKNFENELVEMRENRGEIRTNITNLEIEDKDSVLRLEKQNRLTTLEAEGERWAVLTLALAMIKRTRERYEKERQPEVVRRAQEYFSTVTAGRYHILHAPLGENIIEPEDKAGRRKSIDKLSRGTQEQLYLCLRLGLINDFSVRSEALPIIVDDVMVNFDPARAEAVCRLFAETSAGNQVLLFTCHPQTVEMMKTAAPDLTLIEADGKDFK